MCSWIFQGLDGGRNKIRILRVRFQTRLVTACLLLEHKTAGGHLPQPPGLLLKIEALFAKNQIAGGLLYNDRRICVFVEVHFSKHRPAGGLLYNDGRTCVF